MDRALRDTGIDKSCSLEKAGLSLPDLNPDARISQITEEIRNSGGLWSIL